MITQLQKGKNYFYQISLAMLVAMISIVGCKKNEPVGPTPVITDFKATSGWVGDVVIIQGDYFGSDVASNIVKFGDKVATVSSAIIDASSRGELKVIVPAGATTGKISVTVNGVTGTSTTDFVVNTETVYICGQIYKNGKNIAGYWKNNTFVPLSDGTRNAIANGIVVVGNHVYVVGAEASTTTSVSVAKYWKNGVSVNLSGVQNANATGIAVVGNDVYVAGTEIGSTLKYVARYWKNGVLTILSDGTIDELTGNIVVSGNDVYVLSTTNKYWKNGVANIIVSGNSIVLTSIAVAGSDVYVGGRFYNTTEYNSAYWKNGIRTDLVGASVTSLVITGGDVHSVGIGLRISNPGSPIPPLVVNYWKNTMLTPINKTDGYDEFGTAISVTGSDVHIAGVKGTGTTGSTYTARYWKNGIGVNLGNIVDDARATGIVVIP